MTEEKTPKISQEEANKLIPEVLYEDEDILAINKPAGLIVHLDGKNTERTLCDWLVENYPDIKNVGEPLVLANGEEIPRPGIVHRLDRQTSGVMVVAKTSRAFEFLKQQFQDRNTQKEYRAIVYGAPSEDFGTINAPLGRSKGDFRQYTTPAKARGELREAITHFEVFYRGETASFVKAVPKTGRTHQIRAHMVHIGHPVVCDRVYALKRPCLFNLNRTALHAYNLQFDNLEGKRISVRAPIPEDMMNALKEMGVPQAVINKA